MPVKRQPKYINKRWGFQVGGSFNPRTLAIKANAKANYALSQLNTEQKVKNFSISLTPTTTPYITVMNALAQGTTNITRIGDSVRWTSFQMRGRMDGHTTTDNLVRIVFLRDHSPRGANPSYTDIFEGSPSVTNVQQYRNLDNIKRFDILWDKTYVVPAQSSASSSVRVIEKFFDLEKKRKKNKKGYNKSINETNYGLGAAGGVADISENGFFILVVSDNTAAPVDLDLHFRGRYLDN